MLFFLSPLKASMLRAKLACCPSNMDILGFFPCRLFRFLISFFVVCHDYHSYTFPLFSWLVGVVVSVSAGFLFGCNSIPSDFVPELCLVFVRLKMC